MIVAGPVMTAKGVLVCEKQGQDHRDKTTEFYHVQSGDASSTRKQV